VLLEYVIQKLTDLSNSKFIFT